MKIFINIMDEGVNPTPVRFDNIRDAGNALIVNDGESLQINKDYMHTVVLEMDGEDIKSIIANDCAYCEAEDIIRKDEREYAGFNPRNEWTTARVV